MRIYAVYISFIVILVSGCSSVQKITLSNNGSGSGNISVHLDSLLMQYADDVAGGLGSGEGRLKLFDTSVIRDRIGSLPGMHLKSIESKDPNKLYIAFSFDSINNIITLPKEKSSSALFKFSEKNGLKTLSFSLTIQNFSLITSLFGLGENEITRTFGPQEGNPLSKDEYYGMMEYLFDEYASREEIDAVLDSSVVSVIFILPGDAVKVEGSRGLETALGGKKVKVLIPLVQLLTLEKPVTCSFSWK